MPPSAFYSGVNQRQRTDERTTIDMSLLAEDMEAYYECNAAYVYCMEYRSGALDNLKQKLSRNSLVKN